MLGNIPNLVILLFLSLLSGIRAAPVGRWTGWITDDHCGAKGASADHKMCAEKCLANGFRLILYCDSDKKLYKLDKQEIAKEHLGHAVVVTGTLAGDSITVASIDMLVAREAMHREPSTLSRAWQAR